MTFNPKAFLAAKAAYENPPMEGYSIGRVITNPFLLGKQRDVARRMTAAHNAWLDATDQKGE